MTAPEPVTGPIAGHPLVSQWLDFSSEGRVRARSGRVELGQGIALALRQIAADALSVGLDQVDLVAGDTRECPDELYTAGSMSVEVGGRSLRAAARAARSILLARAGELLQADGGTLDVERGAVAGTGLDYWRLAAEVRLDQPVMEWIAADDLGPLGPPSSDLDLVAGDRLRERLGGGAFIQDLVLDGMRHARIVSPPHPAARLVSLDTDAIAALPGVLSVHWDGAMVAVLADTELAAISAAERAARHAEWDAPDGGRDDPQALLAQCGPRETLVNDGISSEAAPEIRTRVSRPFLSHASIGTCCALATTSGDRLTVWTHAQGSHPLRAGLALALGLDETRIDVIHVPGAGCYGHNGADDVAFEAALLARAHPGRPIRLLWTRAQELTRGPLAPAMTSEVAIGLGPDGAISSIGVDVLSAPHQRRPGPGKPNFAAGPMLAAPVDPSPPVEPPAANGGGADRNGVPIYRTTGMKLDRRIADAPVRTSAMRALGAFVNVTALELAMDAAADATGTDPAAFRLAHLDDPRARAVIESAVRISGFSPETDGERAMGLGFARYKNKAGYCAVVVEIFAGETLQVPRLWAVADVGEAIDPRGVAAQVEGGAIQALSWTLKEEMPIEAGGNPAVADWEGYPILRFSEIPEIAVDLITDPKNPPLGAGEISQGPTGAAVACAVRRLFGLNAMSLPLTPDRIASQLAS